MIRYVSCSMSRTHSVSWSIILLVVVSYYYTVERPCEFTNARLGVCVTRTTPTLMEMR